MLKNTNGTRIKTKYARVLEHTNGTRIMTKYAKLSGVHESKMIRKF